MRNRAILVLAIFLPSSVVAEDYQPELFKSLKLVYADDFSSGTLDTEHWQVRQGTTWSIKEGVLVGGPSPREFQDKKIAAGDKAHAGFKPVIWLQKVPENLVARFRVRFDAKDFQPRFPLIDVGHHVNTLTFAADTTTLTLKKNQKTIKLQEPYLPLNTWVDVTIELKRGTMLVKLNDRKTVFKDALIDMVDQQQIDFKGIDLGAICIDDVKVYEGVE
ncbi:MAG: hypothetical protein WAO83_04230 [Fuerstiella sp.]